jgi:chromosome segregation ATPase
VTITHAQRRQTEDRIRAAMDRLLRGQIPPGGGCDVKTLAREAAVSRAALYRSYGHLKKEFEQRLARIRADGHLPDPRAAQILRLQDANTKLRQRLDEREREIAELTAFKTTALSRLAAQHTEITRLRTTLADHHNVHALPPPVAAPSDRP